MKRSSQGLLEPHTGTDLRLISRGGFTIPFPTRSPALFSYTSPLICARLPESDSGMQKHGCSSPLRNCQPQGRTSFPISQLRSCVTTTAFPAAIAAGGSRRSGRISPVQMFIPAAHTAVSWGQPGGPDKAAGSEGFMRLLLLNRRGRGGLGGARRAGNGVEKLSPGFVHGLHIAVIFILELPTKFALEMTSESLITAQPGDFLATRCSR